MANGNREMTDQDQKRERPAAGTPQPVEQQVDGDGQRHRGAAPVELVLQRHDQHARHRTHARRNEQHQKGDAHHEPGVVQPADAARSMHLDHSTGTGRSAGFAAP